MTGRIRAYYISASVPRNPAINVLTHTVSHNPIVNKELFAVIGNLALDQAVADAIGMPVTTAIDDIWIVVLGKDGTADSFASARPQKNGAWHMRYCYGPRRASLIGKMAKAAREAGATKIYTNERLTDADLPKAGFKAGNEKPGFVRWEHAL